MPDIQKELSSLAAKWELNIQEELTEEHVIAALAKRVEILLSRDVEGFFQSMYRLDISEKNLVNALEATNPPESIARLIWQRQWEKAKSRSEFIVPPPTDADLKW